MPKYIVFTDLSSAGCRKSIADPSWRGGLTTTVEEAGGTIVEQYALLGPHQFCTVVEVRDNDAAHLLKLAGRTDLGAKHTVAPAIDLPLFVRLLGRTTENTGPYKWQISLPARAIRRLFRRYSFTGPAKKYFDPLRIIGAEHLKSLRGPAIFIANHSSFMDTPAMYAALPKRYQRKTAYPAAADRFFVKGRKEFRNQGWWFSLVANSFPLQRGGGRGALAYADWLIEKGWSIGIFPEGARTSAAKLARFRMGPAILATTHGIPVVPMYLEGTGAIRKKGSREMNPGPVTVRIGPPLRFPPDADVGEATRELHRAVEALGQEAARERRAARELEVSQAPDQAPADGEPAAGAQGEPSASVPA